MDNHRPFHLKNIHSRYNVVVFDENYFEDAEDEQDVPSEASVMSSDIEDRSDNDTLNSNEEDGEQSLADEDEDYDEFDVCRFFHYVFC